MRRLVAGVVLAIAATAIAVPASAHERGCEADFLRDGRSVEAFCSGRGGSFRVVAHCETSFAHWHEYGSVGRTNRYSSRAECRSLIGPVWVDDYHVDWL